MKDNVRIFKLLYSDTDNFIYEIGKNFYEIINKHKEFFDLSNQPQDSTYYCNDYKKVPGKMKYEYGETPIYEFIGLKSEMYSIRNSLIKYEEFKDTDFNKKAIRHKMTGIKSKKHELHTYESDKISLSAFDDKRYILSDGINTLPYGHKDIPKNE